MSELVPPDYSCVIPSCVCADPAPPAEVTRQRLPGRARSRDAALRDAQQEIGRLRERYGPVFWLLVPEVEKLYRWRVQLDCECVEEVLTRGDDRLPAHRKWPDIESRWLPPGQMYCPKEHARPEVYRTIVAWSDREEVTCPADPIDPPEEWSGIIPEVWSKIRHSEPHTFASWDVRLCCGHWSGSASDASWNPLNGYRRASVDRQREMRAEWNADRDGDPDWNQHQLRMIDQGFPLPQPETNCFACSRARSIVAYQAVGWLVPRASPSKSPAPSPKFNLEKRLRTVEREAAALRRQIEECG